MIPPCQLRGLDRPLTGGRAPAVWQQTMQVASNKWGRLRRASGWLKPLLDRHPTLHRGPLLGEALAALVIREAAVSTDRMPEKRSAKPFAEWSDPPPPATGAATRRQHRVALAAVAATGPATRRQHRDALAAVVAAGDERHERPFRATPDRTQSCADLSSLPLRASRVLLSQLHPANSTAGSNTASQPEVNKRRRFNQVRGSQARSRHAPVLESLPTDRTPLDGIFAVARRTWRAVESLGLHQATSNAGEAGSAGHVASSLTRQWTEFVCPTASASNGRTAPPGRALSKLPARATVSREQLQRWAMRMPPSDSSRSTAAPRVAPRPASQQESFDLRRRRIEGSVADGSLVRDSQSADPPMNAGPAFRPASNRDVRSAATGTAAHPSVPPAGMASSGMRDRRPAEATRDSEQTDDLGELADKIRLILNEEARRHGIDV